jgi:hypothetical protein
MSKLSAYAEVASDRDTIHAAVANKRSEKSVDLENVATRREQRDTSILFPLASTGLHGNGSDERSSEHFWLE